MNLAYLVFVDPLSSVEFLTENLRKAGIPSIVIYTLQNLNGDFIRLAPELFDEAFFITDPKEQGNVLRQVKKFRIAGVYAGSETTLALSDQIAKALCPATANDPSCSGLRSNKYLMHDALARAGLNAVKQLKVAKTLTENERAELLLWRYPLVVKPSNSAGSIGVKICQNFSELEDYLLTATFNNFVGQEIPYFVVQDYLQGEEYFVDSFSVNGVHTIGSVHRYSKDVYHGHPLYLYAEVVSEHDPSFKVIRDYALNVLSTLKVDHGFAHTEIMLTKDGPCLIELNPRISGFHGVANKMAQYAGRPSQTDLLIAHYHRQPMPESKLYQPTCSVMLQNYDTRIMGNLNCDLLNQLPSFQEAHLVVKAGAQLAMPVNLLDALGWIILSHPNIHQLHLDHVKILTWQQQGRLY